MRITFFALCLIAASLLTGLLAAAMDAAGVSAMAYPPFQFGVVAMVMSATGVLISVAKTMRR